LQAFTVSSSVSTLGTAVFKGYREPKSEMFEPSSHVTDIPDSPIQSCDVLTALTLLAFFEVTSLVSLSFEEMAERISSHALGND
jgi:hypothetical protein